MKERERDRQTDRRDIEGKKERINRMRGIEREREREGERGREEIYKEIV